MCKMTDAMFSHFYNKPAQSTGELMAFEAGWLACAAAMAEQYREMVLELHRTFKTRFIPLRIGVEGGAEYTAACQRIQTELHQMIDTFAAKFGAGFGASTAVKVGMDFASGPDKSTVHDGTRAKMIICDERHIPQQTTDPHILAAAMQCVLNARASADRVEAMLREAQTAYNLGDPERM